MLPRQLLLSGPDLPLAPSSLAATTISSTRIGLEWVDNSSNETGFSIERKTGSALFAEIDTVAAGESTYTDAGLDARTEYTYRVRAMRGNVYSLYSNQDSATTDAPAPFMIDSFTDADATPLNLHFTSETAEIWSSESTNYPIIYGNRAAGEDTGVVYQARASSGPFVNEEYDVDIVVAKVGTPTYYHAAVMGRLSADEQNGYFASYYEERGVADTELLRLYKIVAGVETLLGSWAGSVADGSTIKLEMRNASKKVLVNGTERISSADNAVSAAGYPGLRIQSADSTNGLHIAGITATD